MFFVSPAVTFLFAGCSAPAPRVTFLSGKVTKAILPRKARPQTTRVPRISVGLRRCAYGASLRRMRTCAIPRTPFQAPLRPVLDTRSPTGRKNKGAKVFVQLGPVWCARAPQDFGRVSEGRCEGSRRSPAGAGMRRRATIEPKPRMRGGCRAIRVRLSFGNFSLARQRKVTCRGSATHKL